MAIERTLALGSGPEYQTTLAEDALVVVPGAVLTASECISAMNASEPWDRVEFGEPRVVEGEATASVVYQFDGWRGGDHYCAILGSTYTAGEGPRRLLLHQQTPVQ